MSDDSSSTQVRYEREQAKAYKKAEFLDYCKENGFDPEVTPMEFWETWKKQLKLEGWGSMDSNEREGWEHNMHTFGE